MQKTRRLPTFVCMVLTLCLLLYACSGKEGPSATAAPSALPSSGPEAAPTLSPTPSPTLAPSYQTQVEQCAGAYFSDISGSPNLYAAMEFTNTGAVPATVESITVRIRFGETTVRETFTPPLAQSDIVEPGARSTAAVWIPYDKKAPAEGETISVEAEVLLAPTVDSCRQPLQVDNVVLVQNYPDFSTVSGTLTNLTDDLDYDLTLVYLSFYDGDDKLLGVAHFTKNLAVPAAESRDFVTHLRSLPIEGLTEKTARITARGIGIR